jgi:hypothetical protein
MSKWKSMVAVVVGGVILAASLAPADALPAWWQRATPQAKHMGPACPVNYSWQYTCELWGPTPPGRLVGSCIRNGWSCTRIGPTQ